MSALRVGIIYGGKSAEHEVSQMSAKNIEAAIDTAKYMPVMIYVDKNGVWPFTNTELQQNIDVAFNIIHGTTGEDGLVQGMLQLAGIPYVGAGVLGSAVGMDKDVMKRLLKEAGIPIGAYKTIRKNETVPTYAQVTQELGSPLFIKPANAGSSIGVCKAKTEEEYIIAIRTAFKYDTKIIIESAINGREIECAVLGDPDADVLEDQPQASTMLGEIKPHHEFYSYEAKYLDPNGAELLMPPQPALPDETTQKIRDIAAQAFTVLNCQGIARVDFFVTADNTVYLNEINTLPGFTSISMYPKLWQESGVSYPELIDRLIQLALKRHKREGAIKMKRD